MLLLFQIKYMECFNQNYIKQQINEKSEVKAKERMNEKEFLINKKLLKKLSNMHKSNQKDYYN